MDQASAWLFESSIWLPLALSVAASLVVVFGAARRDRTLIIAGAVVDGLALLWLALTVVVETPREAALERTRAVVQAYADADWPGLTNALDPATDFDTLSGPALVTAARLTHESLNHETVTLTGVEAETDAAGVRVTADVLSTQGGVVPRLRTAWRFDYAPGPDGTLTLTRIEPLPTEQLDPAQIRGRVVRR